jgi:hypothetical protein
MKPEMKWLLFLIVCVFFGANQWIHCNKMPIVTLQEKDVFSFESKLDENEVFLRNVFGFDYDDRHVYYLENHLCTIYKVRLDTFQLVKMISSRGQGPGELSIPLDLCCKNGKLYVADIGIGGIKIFDTEGKFLKQLKIAGLSFGIGATLKYIIDVNDENEIYVRSTSPVNDTLISVYNINGQRLRGIIPAARAPQRKYLSTLSKNLLIFTLNNSGHIIVLFTKEGKLQKYDKQGKLLWSRNILKELPENERNEESIKRIGVGGIKVTYNFLGLAVLEDNRIFASGRFTGMLLSDEGKVIGLFKRPLGKWGFGGLLFWKGSLLIGWDMQYDFHRYIKVKPPK